MTPFAAWVAAASARLPWWMNIEAWHSGLVAAIATGLAAQALGIPAPVLWGALGAGIGAMFVVAYRSSRTARGLIDPVTHLARLEQTRRQTGDLAVSDSLQQAADDWGRLDRALSLEMWSESPELRAAADTGMLQIALAREAGVPDTEREGALSELVAFVERASRDDADVPDDRLWGLAQNVAQRLNAPHLGHFARRH